MTEDEVTWVSDEARAFLDNGGRIWDLIDLTCSRCGRHHVVLKDEDKPPKDCRFCGGKLR